MTYQGLKLETVLSGEEVVSRGVGVKAEAAGVQGSAVVDSSLDARTVKSPACKPMYTNLSLKRISALSQIVLY
jgi:hypothetical protein